MSQTQKMYPRSINPQPARTPKPPPTRGQEIAAKLYSGNAVDKGVPRGPKALYAPALLNGELSSLGRKAFEVFGEGADQRLQTIRKHGVELYNATKSDETATKITRLLGAAEIADARRTGEAPSKDERAKALRENAEEYRRRLQQTYGTDRAPAILTRVRKFVSNTAAVDRALSKHDLAENPDVVTELADYVYRTNYR
jgi:hypothetical protein